MNNRNRFAIVTLLGSALVVGIGGCYHNFGTGGTGETVVAKRTLREIEPADLQASATTRAVIQPTTAAIDAEIAGLSSSTRRSRLLASASRRACSIVSGTSGESARMVDGRDVGEAVG